MKTPVLSACFAVAAATAFAAPLKDPVDVARDWDTQATQNREPMLPAGLDPLRTRTPQAPLTLTGREKLRAPSPFGVTPWSKPHPRGSSEPLYDAPRDQPPAVLPDNVPPGSKEWPYNGQRYYVIPLNPVSGK